MKIPELIKFPNIKLYDPTFAKPSNIDIIIGIDLYEQVIGNEKTKVWWYLRTQNSIRLDNLWIETWQVSDNR